ncbi:MAG TPA: CheR family methyltransferase [Planctomycetota bacterium]|nr:CheR family methyltransferase [Planctomycetota bacterium]
MNPTLSRADVERFRAAVCRRFGLRFDDSKLEFLEDVLRARLTAWRGGTPAALGARSHEYLERLNLPTCSRDELNALAQALTVNETFFFRNQEQFRALEARLETRDWRLEERSAHANLQSPVSPFKTLRVLSAGCASGEEAYSLAIAIRERLPDGWSAEIAGIDLNPAVIEKARRAHYSEWSLRGTDDAIRERYFSRDGNDFVLNESVRKMVTFDERNLIHDDAMFWRPHSLDVVFCRNVTMYFPNDVTQAVIARIARALVPGGYLFLGHAETLRGISNDFHLRHTHDTFYYQRKETIESRLKSTTESAESAEKSNWEESTFDLTRAGETAAPLAFTPLLAGDTSWIGAIQQASERIAALAKRDSKAIAPDQSGTERELRSTGAAPPPRANIGPETNIALELLRAERYADAIDVLNKLPAHSQADADVQLLRAVLLTHAGKLADAQHVCDQLLAKDELNAGAHYLAALCREHAGDASGAKEHNQAAAYLNGAFAMPHLHLGLLARRAHDAGTARRELDTARTLLRCEDASRILLFGGGFSREALIELCNAELRTLGEA